MPLNIKNEDAHRLARELARLTGTSITDAVTSALRDAVRRLQAEKTYSAQRLMLEIEEIALHCASLPVLDTRPADEILGYGKDGLPE